MASLTDQRMNNWRKENLGEISFPSLFLPKEVPGEYSDSEDAAIAKLFSMFLSDQSSTKKCPLQSTAKTFCDLYYDYKNLTAKDIRQNLQQIKGTNGFTSLYIKEQSAVVVIADHYSLDGKATLYTWEARAPNEEVMSSLSLSIDIPRTGSQLHWDQIESISFSELLFDLITNQRDKALPKSTKSGQAVHETRNAINPMYVTEWLLSTLGGEILKDEKLGTVQKKLRDQIEYRNGRLPWYRSPLWFALKTSLHFISIQVFGSAIEYKQIVQKFLCYALNSLLTKSADVVSKSAIKMACSKLVRREAKLKEMHKMAANIPRGEGNYNYNPTPSLNKAVTNGMKIIETSWKQHLERVVPAIIDPSKIDIERDVKHQLNESGKILDDLAADFNQKSTSESKCDFTPDVFPRSNTPMLDNEDHVRLYIDRLSQYNSGADDFKHVTILHQIALAAFETFNNRTNIIPNSYDMFATQLFSLLEKYMSDSIQEFKEDAREISESILASFAMVLMIDYVACQEHPLLKEHELGFNATFMESILLTTRYQKQMLQKMESYVSERNESQFPSTLNTEISEQSFSVRYFQRSALCQNVLHTIQEECRTQQDNKEKEKLASIERYQSLVNNYTALNCKCQNHYYADGNFWYYSTCTRCELRSQANGMKIRNYEKLLPSKSEYQHSIVYDICLPTTLHYQRESIAAFYTEFCNKEISTNVGSGTTLWRNDGDICQIDEVNRALQDKQTRLISLGSTTKKFSRTHYSRNVGVIYLSKDTNLTVENGCNAILLYDGNAFIGIDNWTWDISKHCFMSLPKDSIYKSLETVFNSWRNDENEIIARKSQAHLSLTLREFIAAGNVRTGICNQLVRLVNCITQRSLSFETIEITNLLMWTLFQVGPPISLLKNPPIDSLEGWRRQGFEILKDTRFAEDVLIQCDELLDCYAENWSNYYSLLNVVMISKCIYEHVDIKIKQLDQLFVKARNVAFKWIQALNVICNQCKSDDDMQHYRKNIAAIAVIGTLTYGNGKYFLNLSSDDLEKWIYFRAVTYDNIPTSLKTESSWIRTQLCHAKFIADSMYPILSSHILENSCQLNMFLRTYWSGARKASGVDNSWTAIGSSSDGWYSTVYENDSGRHYLHLDVINGCFLVNGKSCNRLPKSIISHPIYKCLFGDSVFVVQSVGNERFKTSISIRGSYYEFQDGANDNDFPIIIEIRDRGNGKQLQLIPNTLFKGEDGSNDLPDELVDDYSHWMVLDDNDEAQVYFRPPKYNMQKFYESSLGDYILKLNERVIVNNSGEFLLDVQSKSFKELEKIFTRLTAKGTIHAFARKENNVWTNPIVKLPKLRNLSFELRNKSELVSKEYRGMIVSENQNFGSLIGLQRGLVLHASEFEDRIFICPHGKVDSDGSGGIEIDVQNLRTPPFYKYTLRTDLFDIRAGKERLSSEYLALLHAHTSGLLPDSYTNGLGLTKALEILRSGHCSGNLTTNFDTSSISKLDSDVKVLLEIAEMAPQRSEYHSMEQNDMSSLRSNCFIASEVLTLMAFLRLKDIETATRLIGENIPIDWKALESRTHKYSLRAYLRNKALYSNDCLLTETEEKDVLDMLGSPTFRMKSYTPDQQYDEKSSEVFQQLGYISQNDLDSNHTTPLQLNGSFSLTPLHDDSKFLENLLYGDGSTLVGSNLYGIIGTSGKRKVNSDEVDGFVLTGSVTKTYGKLLKLTSSESLRNLFLNMYELARHIKPQDVETKRAFGYLLSHVIDEHPQGIEYVQFLQYVALHPSSIESFPPTPNHNSFSSPKEFQYNTSNVSSIIGSHIDKFDEEKPLYDKDEYQKWLNKKNQHEKIRENSRKNLSQVIASAWNENTPINDVNLQQPKVVDSDAFRKKIQNSFKRWKAAIELRSFIQSVDPLMSAVISNLKSFDFNNLVPIRILDPKSREKDPFLLETNQNWGSSFVQEQIDRIYDNDDTFEEDMNVLGKRGVCQKAHIRFKTSKENQNDEKDVELIQSLSLKFNAYQELYDIFLNDLSKSWSLATKSHKTQVSISPNQEGMLEKKLLSYHQYSIDVKNKIWVQVKIVLEDNFNDRLRERVGLWNSITPYSILLEYFKNRFGKLRSNDSGMTDIDVLLSAFAVAISHCQRSRRCLRMFDKAKHDKALFPSLQMELQNDGCNKWNPEDYPEFLAFEVDNDVTIRTIQTQVALEILSNKHGNRLLQLNMGGGKTSVIMPIVLSVAARGRKLVRATVLSSLYPNNAADWQQKMGGLLGRKIYALPCKRDMSFDTPCMTEWQTVLTNVRDEGNVIVTVPEHRLSLDNKALEFACQQSSYENHELSNLTHKLLKFIWDNARDFLDESDEILSPKYQLIYTLGSPQNMEGGPLRWSIHMAALKSVADCALDVQKQLGAEVVSIEKLNYCSSNCYYPNVRLLENERTKEAFDIICKHIIDDILSGRTPIHEKIKPKLMPEQRNVWQKCILNDTIPELDELDMLESEDRTIALTLRGLLQFEVLKSILQKRWRVDYGRNENRSKYFMAVPFKAKDVAAERTEYGHPDMALSLTISNYYHSGLNEGQLKDTFNYLIHKNKAMANTVYDEWVSNCDHDDLIKALDGINLDDHDLFERNIYPVFRFHMDVINFWLTKLVFPSQAKQFPMKLTSTSWDLCRSDRLVRQWGSITTGFSGTDDLHIVLPQSIRQKNIEELERTNGDQLKCLIREENNRYIPLNSTKSSCGQILEQLSNQSRQEERINVVLDAGALILEMSNEQFARSWLKKRTDMDGVAYFDANNVIKVVTRDNSIVSYDVTSYSEDMSKCLLYLDDIHTRGSDFVLPQATRAILTLGKGMPKDKLLQASMRMRKLGSGQSITFVASSEVDAILKKNFFNDSEGTEYSTQSLGNVLSILNWAFNNNLKRNADLLPYYAIQGRSCIGKSKAYDDHYFSTNKEDNISEDSLKQLSKACLEEESTSLMDLYGHSRGKDKLPNIIIRLMRQLKEKLSIGGAAKNMVTEIEEHVAKNAKNIEYHCSMFDEEQERELEMEIEEEKQLERPSAANHFPSEVSIDLFIQRYTQWVKGSCTDEKLYQSCFDMLYPIGHVFEKTNLKQLEEEFNDDDVFVTKDFIRTIEGNLVKDWYLKNVQWVCMTKHKNPAFVIISNHEAEWYSRTHMESGLLFSLNENNWPKLFSFNPIVRNDQQASALKSCSLKNAPASLHLLAGSIHAEKAIQDKMANFLGLFPRPIGDEAVEWDLKFKNKMIQRDGFVEEKHRLEVFGDGANKCPFKESPIESFKDFLSESRHLVEELRSSPLGRRLGCSFVATNT